MSALLRSVDQLIFAVVAVKFVAAWQYIFLSRRFVCTDDDDCWKCEHMWLNSDCAASVQFEYLAKFGLSRLHTEAS